MELVLGLGVVLLVSGLIAYVGDALGRRIGRKRLSLLGLRPRNTAIVFTVVTGMFIAGATLGTTLALSREARDRILGYRRIVTTLQEQAADFREQAQRQAGLARSARQQRAAAERNLVVAEQALRQAEGQRREAEVDLAAAEQQLGRAEATLARANTARQQAEARARRAAREVEARVRDLREVQARYDAAARDLRAANAASAQARAQYEEAARRLDDAQQRVAEAQARLAELQAERGRTEEELADVRGELRNAEAELRNAEAFFREQFPRMQAQREEVARLAAEEERIRGELEQAREQLARTRQELLDELQRLVTQPIVFERGEELGRRRFEAQLGAGEASARLESFLRSINRLAEESGAGRDVGTETATGWFAVPLGVLEGGEMVRPSEYLPALQARLATTPQPVWLRAMVLLNSARGRPVFYTFVIDADEQAFAAGELLATTVIDGSLGEPAIIDELEALVTGPITEAARGHGLLPLPEGPYLRVPPEDWFPALEAIRALNGPARVDVRAARDTGIGEPLSVEFVVSSP